MDQFSQLAGSLLGGQNQPASPLLKAVTEMMSQSGSGGGFAGIIEAFQQKGLGGIVASWISTGENQPITPAQIQQGLGNQTLQQLATKAGISPDQAKSYLSELLPQLVDKLTPGGKVPEGGELDAVLTMLKSKLGS